MPSETLRTGDAWIGEPAAPAPPGALRVLDPGRAGAPLEPERLYGRSAPLVLEIGFGNGRFLLGLARRRPEWNLVGAEISPGSVARAYQLLRGAGVGHTVLFRGQAGFLVRDLLPEGCLSRVYLNFPDPWPKARHAEHRLLQAPFLRILSTRLADGAALCFTTDHPGYFAQGLGEAEATGLFQIEVALPPAETLETKYARKWRAIGKPIHHARLVLAERDRGEPARRVAIEERMHYAILAGVLPAPEGFDKSVRHFPGGCAVALEVLRATRDGGLCFLVRIEEADLVQEVLVDARQKEPGVVFVGVRSFGQPLPTRGTREAVGMVAECLTNRGLELIQRSF